MDEYLKKTWSNDGYGDRVRRRFAGITLGIYRNVIKSTEESRSTRGSD